MIFGLEKFVPIMDGPLYSLNPWTFNPFEITPFSNHKKFYVFGYWMQYTKINVTSFGVET
jgi:hypothetical protein